MMSSAARVAGRVAARAPTQVKARTMATAKNADPLLKAEGWTVKFAQKPTAPATGHAIWDPASKSHAYIPVIGGVVVGGCFLTWLPWEIQGRKWAAAKGE